MRIFWSVISIVFFSLACAKGGLKDPTSNLTGDNQAGNIAVVVGEAPIYQNDRALARNRALKDAKISAVRKVIGEQITRKSGVSDGQSLGAKLYSKSDAFVKNHQILSEENFNIDTQPMIRLTVRCEVEEARISTAVDSLLADIGNPRMVVLVSGNVGNNQLKMGDSRNIAEAELSEALRKQGNKIVSGGQMSSLMRKKPGLQNLSLDDIDSGSPLVEIAQQAGAEVMIIAHVNSRDQGKVQIGNSPSFFSAAVTGPYKLVQLWGDGKVFGSGSEAGRGADITMPVAREKGVKSWAKLVGQKAGQQIKDEWFRLTEENTVILKFTGLSAQDAIPFRDDLTEFTAVKRVNERKSGASGSEWELTYPGKESMFSEELSYKKDRGFRYLARYRMEIISSQRGEVHLRFTPN